MSFFQPVKQRIRNAAPAELRVNAQVIRRAAMPVITAHYRTDDFADNFRNEEQADIVIHLAFNIHFRIVPWTQQVATLPEGDHLFEIFLAKNAYFHGIRCLFGWKNQDYGANI